MVKSTQRGFTLIELVVVIVILGILAAFAVPRFMGLETQARVATVRSMGGTLQSAAAMAHGLCLAQNCTNSVTINGTPVPFAFGYPTGQGMISLVESASGFTTAPQGNNMRFSKTGAAIVNNCWVQYNPPTVANRPPTISYRRGVISPTVTEATIDADLRAQC